VAAKIALSLCAYCKGCSVQRRQLNTDSHCCGATVALLQMSVT